jgi:hypothetical protein
LDAVEEEPWARSPIADTDRRRQVMASAGTGTRGTFEVNFTYDGAAVGPGQLTVFDLSAKHAPARM